jgi:thiamine biosynthesis lipoprotein
MRAIGYDRDFAQLRTDPAAFALPLLFNPDGATTDGATPDGATPDGATPDAVTPDAATPATGTWVVVDRRASWRDVRLDGLDLTVPAGLSLDLGATAKAFTADHCARLVAERTGSGALVSLGGDIATAGRGPSRGWRIRVSDGPGEPETVIALPAGSAIATSSTIRRTWTHAGHAVHHILDPRTGRPAEPVWRTVTVAAPTCVEANTWSTAAIVRGRGAPRRLRADAVTARLVGADGVVLATGGWPADAV